MRSPIHAGLAPVRSRQQRHFVLHAMALGLCVSSLAALGLAIGRWIGVIDIGLPAAALVMAAGPVLGLIVGLIIRSAWHRAAVAVDEHYDLKDRSATALAFTMNPTPTVLHELQVSDAATHLATVEPHKVVPYRLPRSLPIALGVLALALFALLVNPFGSPTVDATPAVALPQIVAEAEKIEEHLKDLEELAKQEPNEELKKLLKELQKLVEEMKQPGVDEREALAKLSEMQAALAAEQAQYNTSLVDGQLAALGEALSASQSTDGAGKALQDAKYEKAAQELEKLEDPPTDRKEAKALEEKLKQVAKAMSDVGLGSMSEATGELADGVKSGKGKFQKGAKVLAKAAKDQARRKKVTNFLANEIDRLNECKCQCNGGPEGKKPQKSTSPSSSWGRTTSGNVQGDKTSLLAERKMEQITGTSSGEGESEVETTHSAEGRQNAQRGYKDVYKEYRRMSEAVLDNEPIPLGHRQTIRKYFELIRPSAGEMEKKDGGESK